MSRSILISVILLFPLVLLSQAVSSCEVLALVPHSVDPDKGELDATPPTRVHLELLHIMPGNSYEYLSGEAVGCRGDGMAGFRVHAGEDDQTAREQLGYRFVLVDGELPSDKMYFPRTAVRAAEDYLYVMWQVELRKEISAVDFTVAVIAVDGAGHEGPASNPIRIQHPRIALIP